MTWHLHLTGLVQGVGFRPFVWQLARAMRLCGTVSNGVDGVHIFLNSDEAGARQFRARVLAEAPALARVETATLRNVAFREFGDFSIVESQTEGAATVWLTPDLALCESCRAELAERGNRRFGYGFTTCTHCGPRYSIQYRLPYDRPATTMAPFEMCPACAGEYHNPADRRFFAQTNSCPDCPVDLKLFTAAGEHVALEPDATLRYVVKALGAGQTVAVKGIGGYLLLADATSASAIETLRRRKHRPTKPLAVLYPNAAVLAGDCYVADDELALLNGPAAPIMLLRQRSVLPSGVVGDALAPGLTSLGVMLPYAPLLALLAEGVGKPLVATSGNVSGSPICYTDAQALEHLPAVADLILTHNRAICVPQDDSVMLLTPHTRQPIVLRRARGLAPTFTPPQPLPRREGPSKNGVFRPSLLGRGWGGVLALGASLKSTFAWQLRGNTYVSQYLGDLESVDTQDAFRHTLNHFGRLLGTRPGHLLADAHEGYFSTQLARQLADEWNVPLTLVQHHDAHVAAVLTEYALFDRPALGIIWDGTGYGTDGHVWGGEFIAYDPGHDRPDAAGSFERIGQFEYFDALLGDKMPREPRLSALSLAYNLPDTEPLLRSMFSPAEWALYCQLLLRNKLKTSSVGRLFDAVAGLLGLGRHASYEGEAALRLEDVASRYVRRHGWPGGPSYLPARLPVGHHVPTAAIVAGVVADRQAGRSVGEVAARFHATLVGVVRHVAEQTGHRALAFGGGVFQNALLVDALYERLDATYRLYFPRQLSPNDEAISLGQLAYFSRVSHQTFLPENAYVFSHSR